MFGFMGFIATAIISVFCGWFFKPQLDGIFEKISKKIENRK